MIFEINPRRKLAERNPMLYGHFLEHFHRQVYGGIYDPESRFADEDGFRTDILEAMRRIKVPILRWPGGCFVSSYHWKKAVGPERTPSFDKAWRVEDPNTFGTDEYIKLCRKIGCEPYICTNAGTGTMEEMSDWVEYCNLETEGEFAKWRIANGHPEPYNVKYWSVGNENYGAWELGAKSSDEWGRLVRESCKLMNHITPEIELSAAALSDMDWNMNLLRNCGNYLDWISIHEYWDMMPQVQAPADYEAAMAFTDRVDHQVDEVRGMLKAMKLDGRIKIAFDEWNLRSWHHPNVHTVRPVGGKENYLTPRDKNDINSTYTMADAVFAACFLNAMNRNADIVGMANFAPILNTRGCIYSYEDGIVLRSTYHVFDLFVNKLGDVILDGWASEESPKMHVRAKNGEEKTVDALDLLATKRSADGAVVISLVNKEAELARDVKLTIPGVKGEATLHTLNGPDKDSYNDVGRDEVKVTSRSLGAFNGEITLTLDVHSVNVLEIL